MNTRSLLIAILCGVCVTLAGVVAWQKKQLDNAAAAAPSAATAGPVVLPPAVSPEGDARAAPGPVAVSAPPRSAATPGGAVLPPAKAGSPETPAKQMMAALAKMAQDPQMKDALREQQRMAVAMTYGQLSIPADPGQDPSALLAPGAAARHVRELETMQARYAARAQAVLSPAQFEAFQKSQEAQRRMQAMGIRMAAQTMGAPEEGK